MGLKLGSWAVYFLEFLCAIAQTRFPFFFGWEAAGWFFSDPRASPPPFLFFFFAGAMVSAIGRDHALQAEYCKKTRETHKKGLIGPDFFLGAGNLGTCPKPRERLPPHFCLSNWRNPRESDFWKSLFFCLPLHRLCDQEMWSSEENPRPIGFGGSEGRQVGRDLQVFSERQSDREVRASNSVLTTGQQRGRLWWKTRRRIFFRGFQRREIGDHLSCDKQEAHCH